MENTLEDNSLLAEFMGRKFQAYNENLSYGKDYDSYKECLQAITDNKWDRFTPAIGWNLGCGNYDKSWDWLMPVVEKIEHIKGVTVILTTNTGCEIFYFGKLIYKHNGEYSKMTGIFNGVVEFIKFYNVKKLYR